MTSIIIVGVIVGAGILVGRWYFALIIQQGKAKIAQDRQAEQIALRCNPSYAQMEERDRQYEMARQKQALEWERFRLERHLALTRVPPEQYLLDYEPASITPLPSLKRLSVQEVEADPPPTIAPPLKTFAQLLHDGTVSTALQQEKLILGYVGAELRYGTWLDLYSCAIAGVTGSGKTTTVLFLLFQAILAGAKLVVIDPHLSDPEESLAARLMALASSLALPPCDDTPSEALRRIRWFKSELARRKKYGMKGPALILVIDEFNGVMRQQEIAEELPDLLLVLQP